MLLVIHSFIPLFAHSFTHSFIRSFVTQNRVLVVVSTPNISRDQGHSKAAWELALPLVCETPNLISWKLLLVLSINQYHYTAR